MLVITESSTVFSPSLARANALPGADSGRNPASARTAQLILKSEEICLVVKVETLPNGEIACETQKVRFTERDCRTSQAGKSGEADGQFSCEDTKKIKLKFDALGKHIFAELKAKRRSEGRAGQITKYSVLASGIEKDEAQAVPAPEQASPVKFKVSGFANLEWEHTRHFGYDGSSGQRNFNRRALARQQGNLNFFANIGAEATRDETSLVSLFEIGELYFGDTASGGGVGARATNVFEVRNLYLNHVWHEKLTVRGGVVTTASDPRSFVFNDHLASAQAAFKTDLSEGLLWYGEAAKSRVAAAHSRDRYIGINSTLGFLSGAKATLFALHRRKDSEELSLSDGSGLTAVGDSRTSWLGTTAEAEPWTGFSVQATGIGQRVTTRFNDSTGHPKKDSFQGYLADMKVSYTWGSGGVVSALEGLATSGASRVTDAANGKQIQGRRANFVSPVAASYLLTIATSDGVDDAAGSPKESIIANLNLDEGLRILVASFNVNLGRKFSGFLRLGHLEAANGSAATNKRHLGDEADLGVVYQMSPSTSLQFDYGYFGPGDFYGYRSPAQLAATKMKFTF